MKARCSFTHAWRWWHHRFWFLAGQFYSLEKTTIQWCLGCSFLLIIDDMVTLDCTPTSCCNLCVTVLPVPPQIKKIPFPLPVSQSSSVSLHPSFPLAAHSVTFTFVSTASTWRFIVVPATCFHTSWAWDTRMPVLYTVKYKHLERMHARELTWLDITTFRSSNIGDLRLCTWEAAVITQQDSSPFPAVRFIWVSPIGKKRRDWGVGRK